ncbi:MAG: polysaccharide pyruvyl transferase family protein, partial [Oscillospiraceae bacterium]
PDWIDNDNGISVITINNAKAAAVFEEIRPEFNMLNKISTKEAMTKNRRNVTRQMHSNRDNFLRSLAKTDFAKAEKANIKSKYDVALYGNTLGSNYGGIMTYFALYRYMSNIGKNVVMIRPPKGKSASESEDFFERYTNLTMQRKLEEFRKYNNIADTFVIGSDQIWNYKLFSGKRLSYYLNFVDDSKKKIAYAASFGFEVPTVIDFKPEVYPKTFENLNKLDSIAVREIDGVDVCRKYYGSSAVHVLDPVFLVSREEYLEIAENAERKSEGKFLTVYTLTPGADYNKAIRFTAEKLGLPRVNMGPGTKKKYELKKKNFDEPYLVDTTIEEWIYNIANAEYVITDSYHCVCFSIIFRKKFIIVQKSWAISRIRSLLEKLGLTDRWVESSDELINNPDIIFKDIDYDKVYEILEKEVDISKNWLSNALDSPKNVSLHSIMFPEKMNVPVNDYFVSLRKSKDDYIYIAVKYEDNSDYLEPVNLPRNMNIGEKTKTNINNSPFVCICDPKSEISLKKKSDFPLVNYKYNDINFAAFSCKNEASGRCAKVSIENINGKKDIYNCNYESNGMYFFVYSKKRNKIIDVKFIGDDFITLNFN